MDSGIYKIENQVNGKVYIGKTKNTINIRVSAHRRRLNKDIHNNQHLQRSWKEYGAENFSFDTLIECREEILLFVEEYWINYYDAYDNEKGYNIRSSNYEFIVTDGLDNISGEDHYYWKGGKVSLNCMVCGKEFKVYPYRKNTSKYCGFSCRSKEINKGEKSPNAKLSKKDVLEIKRLLQENRLRQCEIAEKFDVTSQCIYRIKTGKSWGHIDYEEGN